MKLEVQRQLPPSDRTEEVEDNNGSTELVPTVAGLAVDLAAANINVAGDSVTVNTAWMPDEQRELARWLYGWWKDSGMTAEQLDHDSGIDKTTMSRLWNDRYRYQMTVKKDGKETPHPRAGERIDVANICERIARYKKLCEDRAAESRMPFMETSVWFRVDQICREALVMQAIAHVYGASQIGKTASLKEHQRRNNHGITNYVLTPAGGGKLELLKAIATACRIPARLGIDQLKFRIRRFLDPTKLLILDEVHEFMLSYTRNGMAQCLAILRQLQEASGCGMVLCGTNAFRTALEEGEFAQSLLQLRRRGIWELQLEDKPTWDDLTLIADHYKLGEPTGEAMEHITWIRSEMGLGKYCKFLTRAKQLADKRKDRMTWSHFTEVIEISAKLKAKPAEEKKKAK